MGELINFQDYKAKVQATLDDFLADLEKVARLNERTLEDEISDLDPIGALCYEKLTSMLAKLDQWEAVYRKRYEKKFRYLKLLSKIRGIK